MSSSLAQKYFYELLIKKEHVRSAISDILEAILYRHDDIDEVDTPDITEDITEKNLFEIDLKETIKSLSWIVRNTTEALNISKEDKVALTTLLFWQYIFDTKGLEACIEKSNNSYQEHTPTEGLVFILITHFVETNIWIPDALFSKFIASNTKEALEQPLVEALCKTLALFENTLRKNIFDFESLGEYFSESDDFLDDTEREKVLASLNTFLQDFITHSKKEPQIQQELRQFEDFWAKIHLPA